MKFIVKGDVLLKWSGCENSHQLALKSRISAPTMHRILKVGDDSRSLNLEHLALLLVDGCGMTPEQAANVRLGDIFELRLK